MENFSINPIGSNTSKIGSPEVLNSSAIKANNEFATLFYKEILSQCFKDGLLGDDEGPYAQMTKDILVENLAKEFAAKNGSIFNLSGRQEYK